MGVCACAIGATSNPVIVLTVLKQEMDLWRDRIRQVIDENPTWSETQVLPPAPCNRRKKNRVPKDAATGGR